jgi:hypothetical protein
MKNVKMNKLSLDFKGTVSKHVQLPHEAVNDVKAIVEIVLTNQEDKKENLLPSYLRGTA